jgi:hypothetical protein
MHLGKGDGLHLLKLESLGLEQICFDTFVLHKWIDVQQTPPGKIQMPPNALYLFL